MKKRLDVLLVERGIAPSRERAQAMIMSGEVYVQGQKADKAGKSVEESENIEYRGAAAKYVSRGGYKLEKAISSFSLDLGGLCCIDVGASTGGFTDCMLQNGAVSVISIDVGYGQLAWNLRCDPRVTVMERTNIRRVTAESIGRPADFVSIDVSFISLTLVLPVVRELMREDGNCVCLVKPQFEAGRSKVGRKGVVRDPAVHLEVLKKIRDFAPQHGMQPLAVTYSPIKGPEGNIEYLMLLHKSDLPSPNVTDEALERTVSESHQALHGGI